MKYRRSRLDPDWLAARVAHRVAQEEKLVNTLAAYCRLPRDTIRKHLPKAPVRL